MKNYLGEINIKLLIRIIISFITQSSLILYYFYNFRGFIIESIINFIPGYMLFILLFSILTFSFMYFGRTLLKENKELFDKTKLKEIAEAKRPLYLSITNTTLCLLLFFVGEYYSLAFIASAILIKIYSKNIFKKAVADDEAALT